MAVIKPPDIPFQSPLWGLSFRVEKIQSQFYGLYQDVQGVWLVGDVLSWPFYFISYSLGEAVGIIREGDVWLVKNRTWLEAIYDGSKFSELLNDVSSNIRWIRTDPIGWLRQHLSMVSYDFQLILSNGSGWVRDKVLRLFPVLSDIQFNPYNWIRSLIQASFGAAFVFLINPRATLHTWVNGLSPFLAGIISGGYGYLLSQFTNRTGWFSNFLSNPVLTVRTWIIQINPELLPFMENPRQWFNQKIAERLGISYSEAYNLPTMLGIVVLRSIKNQIEPYRGVISSLLCDIVLRFI